jgi:hypothetical protein
MFPETARCFFGVGGRRAVWRGDQSESAEYSVGAGFSVGLKISRLVLDLKLRVGASRDD